MISRETENVQSSSDVEQAFRALTSGDKPYITAQELYAVWNKYFINSVYYFRIQRNILFQNTTKHVQYIKLLRFAWYVDFLKTFNRVKSENYNTYESYKVTSPTFP